MKTYSLVILSHDHRSSKATWMTNWDQYLGPDDINWQEVEKRAGKIRTPLGFEDIGYGWVYGHNSRNVTSPRNRRILFQTEPSGSVIICGEVYPTRYDCLSGSCYRAGITVDEIELQYCEPSNGGVEFLITADDDNLPEGASYMLEGEDEEPIAVFTNFETLRKYIRELTND